MRNWKEFTVRDLEGNRELLKEFYIDYNSIFSKPCTSCQNKLHLYFKELINFKPKTMSKTCILKPGLLIYIPSLHKHVNANTITDEDAFELLKNPKHKKNFIALPTKAKEDAKESAADVVKKVKAAESVEDVNKLIEGDERASVIKAGEKRLKELVNE